MAGLESGEWGYKVEILVPARGYSQCRLQILAKGGEGCMEERRACYSRTCSILPYLLGQSLHFQCNLCTLEKKCAGHTKE